MLNLQVATALEAIVDLIVVDQKFERGDYLGEQKLVTALNSKGGATKDTTRGIVREALASLQAKGYLDREPGKGYRIPNYDEDELMDTINSRRRMERAAISTLTADKLAEKELSGHVITDLRYYVSTIQDSIERLKNLGGSRGQVRSSLISKAVRADIHFHRNVLAAAGHREDARYADRLIWIIILHYPGIIDDYGTMNSINRQHADLVDWLEVKYKDLLGKRREGLDIEQITDMVQDEGFAIVDRHLDEAVGRLCPGRRLFGGGTSRSGEDDPESGSDPYEVPKALDPRLSLY